MPCWKTRCASAGPSSASVPVRGRRLPHGRHARRAAARLPSSADASRCSVPHAGSPARPRRARPSRSSTSPISRQSRPTSKAIRSLVDLVELAGARTLVAVPMLKEDELVGAIIIYRQEVRPFTESRSSWSRTSPPRPSSPSRTRGCSTNCANRSSSRPPPPTCSRSSAARHSICRRCSIRWSNQRLGSARRTRPSLPAQKRRSLLSLPRPTAYSQRIHGICRRYADQTRARLGDRARAARRRSRPYSRRYRLIRNIRSWRHKRLGDFRTVLGVPMLREGVRSAC